MARIAGVNIPTGKRVEIALTYIFGIGRTKARQICAMVGVPGERRVNELTDDEVMRIRESIDRDQQVEGESGRDPPPISCVVFCPVTASLRGRGSPPCSHT